MKFVKNETTEYAVAKVKGNGRPQPCKLIVGWSNVKNIFDRAYGVGLAWDAMEQMTKEGKPILKVQGMFTLDSRDIIYYVADATDVRKVHGVQA